MCSEMSAEVFLGQCGLVVGSTVGEGSYAVVKAIWSTTHRAMFAAKIIHKAKASARTLSLHLPRELAILQKVHHPNILQTIDILETPSHCFILQELGTNGNLLDYLHARGRLPEAEARSQFQQLCSAVTYCHLSGIAHRDLKLENVLLDGRMDVKLGDFGFAVNGGITAIKGHCGSPDYAAPELWDPLLESTDGTKSDVWSLAVVLYALVTGCFPFTPAEVTTLGSRGIKWEHPQHTTPEFRELAEGAFSISPHARPDVISLEFYAWYSLPSLKPPPLSTAPKFTFERCFKGSCCRRSQ